MERSTVTLRGTARGRRASSFPFAQSEKRLARGSWCLRTLAWVVEAGFVTRSADNGTPFLRIIFYLELFWTVFPSNPVESPRITIFESANIGTFVRDQSAFIEIGVKKRFRADSGRFEHAKSP